MDTTLLNPELSVPSTRTVLSLSPSEQGMLHKEDPSSASVMSVSVSLQAAN